MIIKPEKIIKRIHKAIGKGQSVLLIGKWSLDFIREIRINGNILTIVEEGSKDIPLESNSFTRIVTDYSCINPAETNTFYNEFRRLLLPTGMIIISANCEEGFFEKLLGVFKKPTSPLKNKIDNLKQIKPKILQNQIHDNGFLIDGYYGYPEGHILMMAQIQNKEVSTLFAAEKQETIQI